MRRILLAIAAIAVAALLVPSDAEAQSRSSGTRVKIHRAKLKSSMLNSQEANRGSALEPCATGDLEIGTIQAERGARVPRDVTVVVDGDVINLNDGRGSHVCR